MNKESKLMRSIMFFLSLSLILSGSAFGDIIFQDDFESYDVGTFPSSGGWLQTFPGGPVEISSDYAYTGSQSLKITAGVTYGGATIDIIYENHLTFEVAVYITEEAGETWIILHYDYLPSTTMFDFYEGQIRIGYWDDMADFYGVKIPYTTNTWYKLKAVCNFQNQTFNAYINDSNVATGLLTGALSYANFEIGSTGGASYFDDVRVERNDSDGDGILDDGDLDGVVGDNPCTGGNIENCDDNCPNDYNPNQEDESPTPDGNGIPDACDCEGNFDCDEDCDGSDAATFKVDFGRSQFNNPCEIGNSCNGDFDCDGDCDGTDAAVFKQDFGRSAFQNPCPTCEVGEWCSYALSTPLPDTGQTKCYDNTQEITCPHSGEDFYGQDAQYVTNPQSYTKLDENGNDLPESAPFWVMVRDNVTGLIWEVKNSYDSTVNYSDPHDADNIYHWSDSIEDGTGTEDFINLLNSEQFGGHSDWRLPTVKELTSIVYRDTFNPSIDITSFPSTVPSFYWSSTTVADFPGAAWVVNFKYGQTIMQDKSLICNVRAVRGEQWGSFDNFIDNGDGTVSDTGTGLMWQQATSCCISPWQQALSDCENLTLAGYDDWRLPDINELQSIMDYSQYEPSVNTTYFPDTYGYYWSSTTNIDLLNSVFAIDSTSGSMHSFYKHYYEFNIRPVRGGR